MTTATDSNVFQKVFALSLASNAVMKRTGTQSVLQAALEKVLPGRLLDAGENWEVVWGPVVWKQNPDAAATGPANSWFVARNPSVEFPDGTVSEMYVVAIAGTANIYDVLYEDLGVNQVVDLDKWVASGLLTTPVAATSIVDTATYVAFGTASAVNILLSQTPPSTAASPDISLYQYIDSLAITDTAGSAKIVFTGHSLGGALSPTMGLGLVLAGLLPGPSSNILAYPTAGPTPGNSNFAKQYSAKFINQSTGPSGYQNWNLNTVNTLDIVPQAWCVEPTSPLNLTKIRVIYGPLNPLLNLTIETAVSVMINRANNSGIIYQPIPYSFFSCALPLIPRNLKQFLADALTQHTTQYKSIILPSPSPTVSVQDDTEAASNEETYLALPVLGTIVRVAKSAEQGPAVIE